MYEPLLAASDAVAVGVTVIATLVVAALVATLGYLLKQARDLRRQATALAREARQLVDELGTTVHQAGLEVERVERMVGSAEAISDAVGSASRLVAGAVTAPFIKLVALGTGVGRAVHLARGAGRPATNVLDRGAQDGGRRRGAKGRDRSWGKSGGGAAARSPARDGRANRAHRPAARAGRTALVSGVKAEAKAGTDSGSKTPKGGAR